MKKKFFISLIIVSIFLSIILINGCGGGSNSVILPPSVSTQYPDSTNTGAYIHIRITWPQNGSKGRCIMSSGSEEKTLTASMPADTKQIIVKVRPAPDPNDPNTSPDDPNNYLKNGYAEILDTQDKITIGPLPPLKVIVRVEAYDRYGPLLPEQAISIMEKTLQLYVLTPNEVDLDLGDYSIGLTPGPLNTYDAVINTHFSIVYPTPTGTPAPAPSPYPVGNRTIKFTVEPNSVTYTGTEPDVTVQPDDIILDPAQLPLNPIGLGNVNVTSKIKPVKATIKATLLGVDGEDTIISNTCDVNLTLPEAFIYLCYPSENLIRGYNQDGTLSITIPNIEEPYNMVMIDGTIYTSSTNGFNINSITRTGTDKKVIVKEDYGSVSNGLTINAYNNFLCMGNGAKLATVNIATGAMHYDFYSDPNCSRIIDLGHNSRWGYFALYSDIRGQNFVTRITSGSCSWNYSVDITTKKIQCERWSGLEYVYLCDDYGIKIHDQVTFNSIGAIAIPGVLNVATDARYMYALCDSKIKILSLEGNPISEFSVKPGATDIVVQIGGSVPSKQKGYYCPLPTPAPESYNRVFNSSNTP